MDIFDDELKKRKEIANKYDRAFKGILDLQKIEEMGESSYAQYVVLAKNLQERNNIKKYLEEKDIKTMIYYPKGMHKMKVFEEFSKGDFKNSPLFPPKSSAKVTEFLTSGHKKRG